MEVDTLIRIDDRIKRVDAVSKARGEAEYLSDLRRDGMLYARMVRSTIPRGRIGNIELPVLPEGYYFISAKDIPENGKNSLVMIAGDWRCFADGDVRYVGETIGLPFAGEKMLFGDSISSLVSICASLDNGT